VKILKSLDDLLKTLDQLEKKLINKYKFHFTNRFYIIKLDLKFTYKIVSKFILIKLLDFSNVIGPLLNHLTYNLKYKLKIFYMRKIYY